MMWAEVSGYDNEKFKRHCGVSRFVFEEMVQALQEREDAKKKKGRPPSFHMRDQLLIALEYWREYRTYFHIANSWKTQESTVSRIVRRMEDALIADEKFQLVGKKALLAENAYEVVVVDATEVPIERPKKNSDIIIAARKRNIP